MVTNSLSWWFLIVTGLAGGLVGLSEITSRYKDAPLRAVLTVPGAFYCALNALGAVGALALIRQMGWFPNLAEDAVSNFLMQAMIAATGTMALFRSSLFTVRVGNADVSIGPAAFLQILMTATDRAVDRARAQPRARTVQEVMKGVDFQKAKQALPALCFGLMQNVSVQEQDTFGTIVAKLETAEMDDAFKANNLGLSLLTLVGQDVLREAVAMLRADIAETPKPIVQSLETLALLRRVTFAASARPLMEMCLFIANKADDADTGGSLRSDQERIERMTVSDTQQIMLLSAVLIARFGEPLVQMALRALPENDPPRSLLPSAGLVAAIAALSQTVTMDNVVDACLILANRAQDAALRTDLATETGRVAALPVTEGQQMTFLASLLVGRLGEDVVLTAVRGMARPDANPR
jgi:hypothetical protein